ncbi:MAG: Nif3-like dinuclear metal center hexameric protein [Nitriliruptor sp.]
MTAFDTVGGWLALVHDRYPPADASSWDNVGLQVGDPTWPVARVLVCLDVTGAVIDEAAEVPGTLVLAHHPLLFRPLSQLTPDTAPGRTALHAATARVAVAAAHTNLDVARDGAGTSDPVADVLGLVARRPLTTELREAGRVKLVTFVPEAHVEAVLDALAEAGAGRIGGYERCAFRVRGQGTFRPGPGTQPFSGRVGEVALEDEVRVEMELPRRRVGAAVGALQAAHPYEEVAYDLVPLLDGGEVGFGVVGELPGPVALGDVAELLRTGLPAPHLRVAGDRARTVRTVATVGGAGDGLIGAALGAGADLYVTGDLRHHVTLDALEQGLALIDAGHHATEVAALPAWIDRLRGAAGERSLTAPVVASKVRTVPWS